MLNEGPVDASSTLSSLSDLRDDESHISDEGLRRVVDGAPASPESGAKLDACQTIQRWVRDCCLPVARRKDQARQRRRKFEEDALEDAKRIVRREHAAGQIQRAWRQWAN